MYNTNNNNINFNKPVYIIIHSYTHILTSQHLKYSPNTFPPLTNIYIPSLTFFTISHFF